MNNNWDVTGLRSNIFSFYVVEQSDIGVYVYVYLYMDIGYVFFTVLFSLGTDINKSKQFVYI